MKEQFKQKKELEEYQNHNGSSSTEDSENEDSIGEINSQTPIITPKKHRRSSTEASPNSPLTKFVERLRQSLTTLNSPPRPQSTEPYNPHHNNISEKQVLSIQVERTLAKKAIDDDMIIGLRGIEEEYHNRLEKGDQAKMKGTQGKGANEGPIAGCIPFNAYLSKETVIKRLTELQEKNKKTVQNSEECKKDFLEEYKKSLKNSQNTLAHENFVKEFNNIQIVELKNKLVKPHITKNEDDQFELLYCEIDKTGATLTEKVNNTDKPIYFVQDKNEQFYKYDYKTGKYILDPTLNDKITQAKGEIKPVQIFNTVQIKLDENTKLIEVDKNTGTPKEYTYGITGDVDTLSFAWGIEYKEENVKDPTQIIEENTTLITNKDLGDGTKKEMGATIYFREKTNGTINHNSEVNHIFPEKIKAGEEYRFFLPNNKNLLQVLDFMFPNKVIHEEISEGILKKDKAGCTLGRKQSVHYIILGGKLNGENKSAKIVEQELCEFINTVRACGYPMPINPLWGWTKNFELKDNFTNEDLIKYIKSNLRIDITNLHDREEKENLTRSIELFEAKLAQILKQTSKSKSSDCKKEKKNDIIKGDEELNEKIKEHLQNLKVDLQTLEEDQERLKKYLNNLAFLLAQPSSQKKGKLDLINQEIQKNEKDILTNMEATDEKIKEIEQENELLNLRVKITQLLMTPEVIYKDVPEDKKKAVEKRVEAELKHRIGTIKSLCKEFWNKTKNFQNIIKTNEEESKIATLVEGGNDAVSIIMKNYYTNSLSPDPTESSKKVIKI